MKKRILISRPDRLGDVVLSTPLPREIKKSFPDSFVAVLAREYTKDVFLHNPYVDEIILFEPERTGFNYFWEKRREISNYNFTHALMLLPNEKINYLLFLAGIPFRVGVGHKFYQAITFTKFVDRKKYIPLRHEADYCMDLARKIGVETYDIRTEIFLSDEEKKRAGELRDKLGNGKKNILLHITSGKSSPNLPSEEYLKLAEKIANDDRFNLIITEKDCPEEFKKFNAFDYKTKELRDLIVLISAGDLMISASTGPAHIAAALGVPTLTLFCPLPACSPQLWSPMGNDANYILPPEEYCKSQCPGDPHICTYDGGITYEDVYQQLNEWHLKNC